MTIEMLQSASAPPPSTPHSTNPRGGDPAVIPDLPRVRDLLTTFCGQLADAVMLMNNEGTIWFANPPAGQLLGDSARLPIHSSALLTGLACHSCPHAEQGGLCRARGGAAQRGAWLEIRCIPIWSEPSFRILLLRREEAPADPICTERRWLAAELHDGVAQVMGSLQQRLRLLDLTLLRNPDPDRLAGEVKQLLGVAAEGYKELRILLGELRIDDLSDFRTALTESASNLQEQSGMLVELRLPSRALSLPDPVAWQVLRIVQEALSNARRHSACSRIHLSWEVAGLTHRFTVSDDGIGFSANERGGGHGLCIMQERARHIGAHLEVTTAPGKGCAVTLTWPTGR